MIKHVTLGAAGAGALWAVACGDDSGSGTADGGACNPAAEILMNHGHTLTIPDGDVRSGTGATYMTSGGTHTHTVAITMIGFRDLQRTGTLMVGTTGGGDHEHPIRISCT